jgi:hypothetical protein
MFLGRFAEIVGVIAAKFMQSRMNLFRNQVESFLKSLAADQPPRHARGDRQQPRVPSLARFAFWIRRAISNAPFRSPNRIESCDGREESYDPP